MNCHICNRPTESFVHEKTHITYYHCKCCDSLFPSPECYQDLSEQKERYNLHENDEDDEGYRAYFQRFLEFTMDYDSEEEFKQYLSSHSIDLNKLREMKFWRK